MSEYHNRADFLCASRGPSRTVPRHVFDETMGKAAFETGGWRMWLLMAPGLSRVDIDCAAKVLVEDLWHGLAGQRLETSSEFIEQTFGIQIIHNTHSPAHLGAWLLRPLVAACWSEITVYCEKASKENVLAALFRGDLPEMFQQCVTKLGAGEPVPYMTRDQTPALHEFISCDDAERARNLYENLTKKQTMWKHCRELVRRNVWDRISWDYQLLSVFQTTPVGAKPVPHSSGPMSTSVGPRKMKVVWIKPDPADVEVVHNFFMPAVRTCSDAVKLELLVERSATWDVMQDFIKRNGWVEHRCELLQLIGENIIIYAAPAVNYLRGKRKNQIATWLSCDAKLFAMLAVPGKALMTRRDGVDLDFCTAQRLCNYLTDLMRIRESIELSTPEQLTNKTLEEQHELWKQALSRAFANWPKYQMGDEVLPDGSLASHTVPDETQYDDVQAQIELIVDSGTNATPDTELVKSSSAKFEHVVLLKLSRCPVVLHNAFREDHTLAFVRHPLEALGMDFRLPCGAYIFLTPEVHEMFVKHMEHTGLVLGPSHVITSASFEPIVMDVVGSLPRKWKISVKQREGLELEGEFWCGPQMEESAQAKTCITVLRTFIHLHIPSSLRSEASGGQRTASTTDADSRIIVKKPRGVVKRHFPEQPLFANQEDDRFNEKAIESSPNVVTSTCEEATSRADKIRMVLMKHGISSVDKKLISDLAELE